MSTSKFHEGLFLKVFQKMCHVFQRKTRVVRWMFVCLSVPLSPWLSFSLSHTRKHTHTLSPSLSLSLSLCWRRRNARQVKTETNITVILLASNHQNHFRSISLSFCLSLLHSSTRAHTLSHPVYCFKSAATLGKKGTDIPMSRRRPFDLNLKNVFLQFSLYKLQITPEVFQTLVLGLFWVTLQDG